MNVYILHGALWWIYNLTFHFKVESIRMFMQTILHPKHLQDQECQHHFLSSWYLEDLMRCHWGPSVHSLTLLHFVVLTAESPYWRGCCHMDKGRNTGGLVCQVSNWCTGIYLKLVLQPRHHHLMVLLGNVLQRRWYHHPMLQWGTGLWWMWHGDTSCGVLKMKCLFPWDCDLCHQHWSVACNMLWMLQDSCHLSWWTPIGGRCCGFWICKVRTLHAALEL